MARPVMLGNGSLTVGLNEHGLVHDFYYPYVGLDNLTTARSVHHMLGVWVDGKFSWVDDGTWEIDVDFESDALISNVRMRNEDLSLELLTTDFVDNEHDAFCRQVRVYNHADDTRDIRLFMHQVFQISRAGRADTALYVPQENYILDYKGHCSLVIYGQTASGEHCSDFAIGNYGIEGKEGTFRDAEDGELSGSAVEHGGVDSVLGFKLNVAAGASLEVDYWVIAADSQFSAQSIHKKLAKHGLKERVKLVRRYWQDWLAQSAAQRTGVDEAYAQAVTKSLMVIKAHTDKHGGVIASCDSSIYNYGRDYYSYVWPRDGAYALWPLIRLGYADEARRFFRFCRDILTPEGYLMHKYQPDRAVGSTWHPLLHGDHTELAIQEDETAIVVFMLGEYQQYIDDDDFITDMYATFIRPAANFMAHFIDEQTGLPHASYDLWEEKFLTTTYTTAVVYQALLVAADFAERLGHKDDIASWHTAAIRIAESTDKLKQPADKVLRKGFLYRADKDTAYDDTLDVSSFFGAVMFGLVQQYDESIVSTQQAIEARLLDQSPVGGSPRYEHDRYFESTPAYLGNPWPVTTLWMAQYYVRLGNKDRAHGLVQWTLDRALPSGVLPEQVHPEHGGGISVTPLVWSHAELLNTVLDLRHK